jgi:hypothetical protein
MLKVGGNNVWIRFDWHPNGYLLNRLARTESLKDFMRNNKDNKETAEIVQRETDRPRMSKSARIAELNLDISRIPEPPSTIMPGTVEKLIPTVGPSQPEKALIAVEGADLGHRNLRIENSLTDEHGDEVKLKKGAQVEITVATKDRASTKDRA